jgi:hypothetical protein
MLLRYAFLTFGRLRGRHTNTRIEPVVPTEADHSLGGKVVSGDHLLKERPGI